MQAEAEKPKEKSKSKSKRFRAYRERVRCSVELCKQELNKDGIADHYKSKHPGRKDYKFEFIHPPAQQILKLVKEKSAFHSYFTKPVKDSKKSDQQSCTDLKSSQLVAVAIEKPKPKTFMSVPKIKTTTRRVDAPKTFFEKPDRGKKEEKNEKEQTKEPVDELLSMFDAGKIRPVLDKLKISKSEKEQQEILSPWKEKLKQLQELCIEQTPVKWNDDLHLKSFKDKTVPESLNDKIGVAHTGSGGDCQFKAVSINLFGSENLHCGLRLLVTKELLENKAAIQEIAKKGLFEDNWESIYERVVSHGKFSGWGNETTKYIISHIVHRPIIVTSTDVDNESTAWVHCRNVKYNADPKNSNKTPIHLLLEGNHYEAILRKNDADTFVDIRKCQNMHPRLSEGYNYIPPGTDEDKDLVSVDDLNEWKKAGQYEDFTAQQQMKYEHLVKRKVDPNEIERQMKEDEELFRIGLREQFSYPKSDELTSDIVSSGSLQGKRPLEAESTSNSSPENVYVSSPETSGVQSKEEKSSSKDDIEMYVDEDNNSITEQSESFVAVLKEIKSDVAETRQLLEKLLLNDRPRNPLNIIKRSDTESDTINLENVMTVDDLMLACPWLVHYKDEEIDDEEFTGLSCTLCYKTSGTKKEGKFSYLSSDGTDFREKAQPQKFRNLKKNVKFHMLNSRHRELAKIQASNNKLSLDQRQEKTGVILGSLAYEAIKVNHSYESYEGKVAAAALRGEDVGTLNHGERFCRKYSESVYNVIMETLQTKLEQRLPGTKRRTWFAVVADKYTATETRSAGQIVGIIAYVDGKIIDIMAEDKQVKNWKGLSLADDIVSSTSKLIPIEIQKQRCVGGCFDGQYLHDGVHNYLMDKMPGGKDDKKLWYSFEWDPAHLIELGINDAKGKLSASANISKVHKLVYQVNKMFTSGKSYMEMKEAAEEHEQRLYAPVQSSPTRFANNEHKALLNFSRNYNLIRDQFSEENVIQDIEHFGFVAALNFQIDLYQEISKVSGNVQEPGKPGWRIDSNVKQSIETIREMVNSLPDSDTKSFALCKNLPHLIDAVNEMEKTQTFRGAPVVYGKMRTRKSRGASDDTTDIPTILSEIKKNANTFVDAFEKGYNDRKTKYKATASATTANQVEAAFSLDNLVANCENNLVPKEFIDYFHLAKKVGVLETDLDDYEAEQQYRRLSYFVKEEYDKAISVRKAHADDQEILEKRIYQMIFDNEHEEDMDVAADLYLSALLRTKAESVAESMGSVVKAVSANRPNLSFEQLARDSVICYNGPEVYSADAPKLQKKAVKRYFVDNTQSGDLHFHRKTAQLSKLLDWKMSEVIDKKKKEAAERAKFTFD